MSAVVFDLNILISAYLKPFSKPARCIDRAIDRQIRSVTSESILTRFEETLQRKSDANEAAARDTSESIRRLSRVISPPPPSESWSGDAEDDHVLATALAGEADYLVTGDYQHLLPLGSFRNIRIVTPAQFLQIIGEGTPSA